MESRHVTRTAAILLIGALVAVGLGQARPARAGQEDVVEVVSHKNFAGTTAALQSAITTAGFQIVHSYDFQQMQQMMAGRTFGPTIVYEYLRADAGTTMFQKDPRAFLEFPLRILVVSTGGTVLVTYEKAEALYTPYRGLGDLAKQLDAQTAGIVKNATR